jgi:hypothetical protein
MASHPLWCAMGWSTEASSVMAMCSWCSDSWLSGPKVTYRAVQPPPVCQNSDGIA